MIYSVPFLVLTVALTFLCPTTDLIACDEKGVLEKVERPRVSAWSTYFNTTHDINHKIGALSLNWQKQVETAEKLMKEGSQYCFHYYSALVNNTSAPPMIRDQAILDSTSFGLACLSLFPQQDKRRQAILKENRNCLYFMIKNEKTYPPQKYMAFGSLGVSYSPTIDPLSPNPKLTEKYLLEALKGTWPPEKRASMLNELGVLYLNRHLGNGQEGLETAYNYYHKIDADESLPLESRCEAKIDKACILGTYSNVKEKQAERQALLQAVKEQEEISPALKKSASIYEISLKMDDDGGLDCDPIEMNRSILEQILFFKKDPSELDAEQIYLLDTHYALCLYRLHHVDKIDFTVLGLKGNELDCVLKGLVCQEKPPLIDFWARSVNLAAILMHNTQKKLPFLSKKKVGDFLDLIIDNPRINPTHKNHAKGMRACLVANGLLPKAWGQDSLRDMQDACKDLNIAKMEKMLMLTELATKIHELYPNHNKEIDNMLEFLINLRKEETNADCQLLGSFIISTFCLRYKECFLKVEEIIPYIQDLLSPKTPENLRVDVLLGLIEPDESTDESTEETADLNPSIGTKKDVNIKSECDGRRELVDKKTTASTPTLENPAIEKRKSEGAKEDVNTKSECDGGRELVDKKATDSTPTLENPTMEESKSERNESQALEDELKTYAAPPRKALKISPPTAIETVTPSTSNEATLTPQQERDLAKAEFYAKQLKYGQCKAKQQEIYNVFRRIGGLPEPTKDQLTNVHPMHGPGSTPGELDGGRQAHLADALETKIEQVKNPQVQPDNKQEADVKPSQNSNKPKTKGGKKGGKKGNNNKKKR